MQKKHHDSTIGSDSEADLERSKESFFFTHTEWYNENYLPKFSPNSKQKKLGGYFSLDHPVCDCSASRAFTDSQLCEISTFVP